MYTLLQVDNIDRTTIADGDKLNSIVTALSANDNAILSDLNDTYVEAVDCKDFIDKNRDSWENSAVKNFSAVSVKDTTILGGSKLSSELSITSNGSLQFVKNDNDTYCVNTSLSTDSQITSSYFIEARLSRNTLLSNEILLLRSGYIKGLAGGSTTLYGRYLDSVDGLYIDGNMKPSRFSDRLLSNAADYHYPCHKFEWTGDEAPAEDYIAGFSPSNGSIIWSTDSQFYGESMSADTRSIALYTKASAYNSSIAIKGGIAVNSSFAFGYAKNENNYEVLETSAIDNSISIYAAYANNNSISMTTEISDKNYNLVSAIDNSMLLLHNIAYDETTLFANKSFALQCNTVGAGILSADNSCILPTDVVDQLHVRNRTFMASVSHRPEANTRIHTIANNSYLIQYATNRLFNYVNSLCISLTDYGKDVASQYNIVNSVVLAANELESSNVINSLLLATHNNIKPTQDISTYDTINIASKLSTTAEANCRLLLPAFAITKQDTVSIANNMSVNELMGASSSLFISDNALQLTGSCKNNVILASKNNIVYNADDSIGLLDTEISASSAYGCVDSSLSQQSAVAVMRSSAISPDHIVEQSIAMESASTSADKSIALFNSNVNRLTSNYVSRIPYAFAMFNGAPSYADSHTSTADNRLSFWSNQLRKRDLPITQFKKISTITSVSELETDVMYIITG